MKILYLSPLSPVAAITLYIRTRLDLVPFSAAHQKEVSGRHTTLILPGFEELMVTVNGQLLFPPFYQHCLERIQSSGRHAKGSPLLAIAKQTAAASPALVKAIKGRLAADKADPAFSLEMMRLIAAWRSLMVLVRGAYPEIDVLAPEVLNEFFGETRPNNRISLSNFLEREDVIWSTFALFSGPLTRKIQSFRPDVVFLNGTCPVNLPFFVAAAKKIRSLHQGAAIFLRHAGGLQNANIHYKDWFLANNDLFDLIDGVIMYTDLADLTCHEIVRNLSAGGEFRGIRNLAYRHNGKVVFSEPQLETVHEYLQDIKLLLPPNFSRWFPAAPVKDPGQQGPAELLWPAPKITMANILATRQACYWYQCNFCDINRQNFILKDPYLSRRGKEVSQMLLDLRGYPIDFAFVDAPAIPPVILEELVKNLTGETNLIPWGYEARFDPVLSGNFVKRLRKAGCIGAIFGLETAVDRVNKLMNKYPDTMNIASIERIIDEFDRNGMMVHVNTIVNLPGMSEDEFRQHSGWLHSNLDRHRLFHFNTNSFHLRRGSAIARRPREFGIELKPGTDPREGYDNLPFIHLPAAPKVVSSDSEIYKECLGFDRIWGVFAFVLHGAYHERLTLSFFDAMRGENFLKRLSVRLHEVARIGEANLRLPEAVRVEDDKSLPFVTVAETREIGTCSAIPRETWTVVERLLKSDAPVGQALDAVFPNGETERKTEVLELIKGLVADGLLEFADARRDRQP